MNLTSQTCVPCKGGTEPLTHDEAQHLLTELTGWKLKTGSLQKEYTFASFPEAIAFVNRVAGIAETQQHHPDIYIWYKVVTLTLTTHAIGGLSRNDFILAAKIDAPST